MNSPVKKLLAALSPRKTRSNSNKRKEDDRNTTDNNSITAAPKTKQKSKKRVTISGEKKRGHGLTASVPVDSGDVICLSPTGSGDVGRIFHSAHKGEHAFIVAMDVCPNATSLAAFDMFMSSMPADDNQESSSAIPDGISGMGKDELENIMKSKHIAKFNIGNGLVDDFDKIESTFMNLAKNDRFFTQWFRKRRAWVTPKKAWDSHVKPLLCDESKAGKLALIMKAFDADFDIKQGWVAASESGYHKPHQDNLTKGATCRIIISLNCYGKYMTFHNL